MRITAGFKPPWLHIRDYQYLSRGTDRFMTYYTVYKTVNLLNGKFYFGVHKTKAPDDAYLGSGTYIKRAVAKYGEQNFRKEVLFIYLDAESAFGKEDELIQCWRGHPLCMNLRKGGSGGFDWINKSVDMVARNTKVSQKRLEKLKSNPEFRERYNKAMHRDRKGKGFNGEPCDHRGRTRPATTRERMSNSAKGERNSQFGTCWIVNLRGSSKKVSKQELDTWLSRGWTRGR